MSAAGRLRPTASRRRAGAGASAGAGAGAWCQCQCRCRCRCGVRAGAVGIGSGWAPLRSALSAVGSARSTFRLPPLRRSQVGGRRPGVAPRALAQARTPPLRRWRCSRQSPRMPIDSLGTTFPRQLDRALRKSSPARARRELMMNRSGAPVCRSALTKTQGARLLSPRRRLSTPVRLRRRSRAFLLETTAGKRLVPALVMSGASARPRVPSGQITMRA